MANLITLGIGLSYPEQRCGNHKSSCASHTPRGGGRITFMKTLYKVVILVTCPPPLYVFESLELQMFFGGLIMSFQLASAA